MRLDSISDVSSCYRCSIPCSLYNFVAAGQGARELFIRLHLSEHVSVAYFDTGFPWVDAMA